MTWLFYRTDRIPIPTTGRSMLGGARPPTAAPSDPRAWLFRDPKTIGMRLDVAVPFGPEEAAWKSKLLLHHASQQARNVRLRGHGFDERILRVNRDTASAAGLKEPYAEGFEVEAGRPGVSNLFIRSRRKTPIFKSGLRRRSVLIL